jgi:hypothetical protein
MNNLQKNTKRIEYCGECGEILQGKLFHYSNLNI